jgi:hypothetical protein
MKDVNYHSKPTSQPTLMALSMNGNDFVTMFKVIDLAVGKLSW